MYFFPVLRRFFLVFVLIFISGCGDKNIHDPIVAVKGNMDFLSWNFDENGIAPLNGEWEFYDNRLLAPGDFENQDRKYVKFPAMWDEIQLNGLKINKKGYATYKLNIRHLNEKNIYAVLIRLPISVCRIWINGRDAGASGEPGVSEQSEKPGSHMLKTSFQAKKTTEIIIQVSNYHNITGGIKLPVLLGKELQIDRFLNQKFIKTSVFAGTIFFIGLFHLGLYFFKRDEMANLYFGLFCLMSGMSTAFGDTGICLMAELLPELPWSVSVNLTLIPLAIKLPLFVMFYHSIFPYKNDKLVEKFYQITAGIFILYIFLTPANAFDPVNVYFRMIVLSLIPYLLIRFIIDLKRKADLAIMLLPAYIFFFTALINDWLYDFGIIKTMFLGSYSILFLILSYSLLISARVSRAYKYVRKLSFAMEEKNQELIRLNLIKDEFIAKTSHELRTPLNGIIGITDSLLKGVSGTLVLPVVKNLKIISSSGRRLLYLIDELLDFSEMKKQKLNIEKRSIDLKSISDEVIAALKPSADQKGIAIENMIGDSFPLVEADEGKLEQVLYNLVWNGIKFTDNGKISLCAERRGDEAVIHISDTGKGIEKKDIERIFESFEQGENITTSSNRGLGLGLSISKHIIELHGGRLQVDSEPGKGSDFSFTLPYGDLEEVSELYYGSKNKRNLTLNDFNLDDIKSSIVKNSEDEDYILAVDDDPVNIKVVLNFLKLADLPVKTAENGEGCLKIIDEFNKPALVLLDIMMPDISGYQVCELIRKRYSEAELPIIMLTARSRQSDIIKGFDVGANDYITKPFSGDELLARVNTFLKLERSNKILQENFKLKKEIEFRKETEKKLNRIQSSLALVFGFSKEAIVGVNESLEVVFSSSGFENFSGYGSMELIGEPLEKIVDEKFIRNLGEYYVIPDGNSSLNKKEAEFKFVDKSGKSISKSAVFCSLAVDEEIFLMIIIKDQTINSRNGLNVCMFIDELNKNRERVFNLEESLLKISALNMDDFSEIQENLARIDTGLNQMIGNLNSEPHSGNVDKHGLGLEVMKLSLEYWVSCKKGSKVDLADRSGIWSIYFEKDGFARTQTLDKYLSKENFPKRPRWRNITGSADFVLRECSDETDLRVSLEHKLKILKASL